MNSMYLVPIKIVRVLDSHQKESKLLTLHAQMPFNVLSVTFRGKLQAKFLLIAFLSVIGSQTFLKCIRLSVAINFYVESHVHDVKL